MEPPHLKKSFFAFCVFPLSKKKQYLVVGPQTKTLRKCEKSGTKKKSKRKYHDCNKKNNTSCWRFSQTKTLRKVNKIFWWKETDNSEECKNRNLLLAQSMLHSIIIFLQIQIKKKLLSLIFDIRALRNHFDIGMFKQSLRSKKDEQSDPTHPTEDFFICYNEFTGGSIFLFPM